MIPEHDDKTSSLPQDSVKDESSDKHHDDEKVGLESFDLSEVDGALELVGTERTAQFNEEYNLKLRRKLVRNLFLLLGVVLNAVVRRIY